MNDIPYAEIAVIVIFLVAITYVYRIVTSGDKTTAEKNALRAEINNLGHMEYPDEELVEYDQKREDIYKMVVSIRKGWVKKMPEPVQVDKPPVFPEERIKDVSEKNKEEIEKSFDDKEFISGTWMKELGPNDMRVLRSALVARAMAVLSFYDAFRPELQGKARLFEKQLIAESQWNEVMGLNDRVLADFKFIRAEADLMEPKWSESILAQANNFRKQAMEQQQRMQMQQMMEQHARQMKASGHSVGPVVVAGGEEEAEQAPGIRQRK